MLKVLVSGERAGGEGGGVLSDTSKVIALDKPECNLIRNIII